MILAIRVSFTSFTRRAKRMSSIFRKYPELKISVNGKMETRSSRNQVERYLRQIRSWS